LKRVVITGMGIVSSLGNNVKEVEKSLKEAKSGITFQPEYESHGLRSQVSGSIDINVEELIDRKLLRFMAKGHAYAWVAMQEAIVDSGLTEEKVSNFRTGIIVGAGGTSTESMLQGTETLKEKGIRRVGPYMVTKTMSNGVSACLATGAKIKGINYAITSACSTSAHCIGNAYELIQMGKQDIMFAGGAEEEHWTMSYLFDAMGAMSTKYNDQPEKASRTFDINRDGFVISGGGSILVLEEYEHAKQRGAKIYAEIVGYGSTSDGYDMVAPSGEGAQRCMEIALTEKDTKNISYINTHGTSTPVGDIAELNAINEVFGSKSPAVSSTKSMTGHSLGATGAHEAIYSLMMLNEGFIAPTINADELCDEAKSIDIVTETRDIQINTVLSNSFGFGGTNASLVISKY